MTRVVGLDLSLTSAGMSDTTKHMVVKTGPEDCIEQRLDTLVDRAMWFCTMIGRPYADLVVIEGSAFSKNQQKGHEELAAIRLMMRHALWSQGIPFAVVPPSTLKLYTTGHGKATKPQMAAALKERHGLDLSKTKVSAGRYDMVDAYALAAMGLHHLGERLPSEGPPPPMKSLFAVPWPPLPARA